MTDSVSEKEEKDVDESEEKERNTAEPQEIEHTAVNNDIYALPIRRRQKKKEELPPGWERHEVSFYIVLFKLGQQQHNTEQIAV